MKTTARILMGLALAIFGLNGFFNFLPQPSTPPPEGAMSFAIALMKTGYMMQLVSGVYLVVAALLLSNRFVPLALILLAPIVVNILAFHVFLDPSTIIPGAVLSALEIYLAWCYRAAYAPLFARPAPPAKTPVAIGAPSITR